MKTKRTPLCLLLLGLLSAGVAAQDSKPRVFVGELDVKVAKIRFEFRLENNEADEPQPRFISLDQNNAEIGVEKFELSDRQVTFALPSVGAKFDGTVNEDGSRWEGTFRQNGGEFPLVFEETEVTEKTHVANWSGVLRAGSREFEFQLRVFEDEKGTRSAVLDSFSESIEGLSTNFAQEGDEFRFEVPLSSAQYVGTLDEAGKEVKGKWIQAGQEFDLNFTSVDLKNTRVLSLDRPQTPKGPFPYDVVNLKVYHEEAKVTLAGTLTLPKGDGPYRTVILVSGSGPQDRDETIVGHKPFAVLADHLTRAGIAVFRFDDRGVGESTGDFSKATSEDFANDVSAIVEGLRKQDRVDGSRIGIVGHSEGGLIAPMVAVKDKQIEFIVLLAGPGVTGREILLKQTREISAVSGATERALDLNQQLLEKVLDRIAANDGEKAGVIDQVVEGFQAGLDEESRASFPIPESAKAQFAQFQTPWFRFFNSYNPVPALKNVECPTLSVIGEKDLQVDCEINSSAIQAALEVGGNTDFQIEKLKGLNHLFQECKTGSPVEYKTIEETLNPALLELVTAWILELGQ